MKLIVFYCSTKPFATTKHLTVGIAADYDSEGQLTDLEILDAQKRFGGTDTMRRVELESVGTSTHSRAMRPQIE